MLNCLSNPTVKDAYRLSIATLVISCIGIFFGFDLFRDTGYSLCFGYALENMISLVSSAIMIWRFFSFNKSIDEVSVTKLDGREQRASIAQTIVLFFFGLILFSSSIDSMNLYALAAYDMIPNTDTNPEIQLDLAVWSFFAFGTLSILKFRYARVLQSDSLRKDAYCSLLIAIIAALIFFNCVEVLEDSALWWVNPTIAMFFGLAIVYINVKSLITVRKHDSIAWYKPSFWSSSPNEKEADTNDSTMAHRDTVIEEVTMDEKEDDKDGHSDLV